MGTLVSAKEEITEKVGKTKAVIIGFSATYGAEVKSGKHYE